MCLPLQLSPGDSPYISLFCPDIQNRHMHIWKHISSTYAFFPLPLIVGTIQPSARGVSSSALSQLSPWLQSCTSCNLSLALPGHCGSPPPNSSLRTLYGLPSRSHGRHSLESSIVGWHLTFVKAELRSLVFERINGHKQMPSSVSTCMHIRWDVSEAGFPSPVPPTIVTWRCQEKCFSMSHIPTPGPGC